MAPRLVQPVDGPVPVSEADPTAASGHITRQQRGVERRSMALIAVFTAVLLGVAAVSLSCGASNIGVLASVQALFGVGTPQDIAAVQAIRLPRVTCAVISGAGLAIAGCVLQSVLENPLAASSTVGISQGAAFGATLAILVVIPAVTGGVATNLGMGTTALLPSRGPWCRRASCCCSPVWAACGPRASCSWA